MRTMWCLWRRLALVLCLACLTGDLRAEARTAQKAFGIYAVKIGALQLTDAASRKTHGAAGDFDIPLPLIGQPGVECRANGGNHRLVVNFNDGITSGNATVTTGTATAGAPTFSGTTMTVPLSAVADIQKLTVLLSGVTNTLGQVMPNTAVSMNVLQGDTNGDRFVNSGDSLQTRSRSGQVTAAANFRSDVNVSGAVNSGDTIIVRSRAGNFVP